VISSPWTVTSLTGEASRTCAPTRAASAVRSSGLAWLSRSAATRAAPGRRERAKALLYAAGRLAAEVLGGPRPRRGLNDAAIAALDLVRRYGSDWERPLSYSRAGRELIRLGFRDDIAAASRLDGYPVLPQFHERRVTLTPVPV